jgi:carbon starvation protein
MFGTANQLLAAVALCVGTTVIINSGKARFAWVTIVPLSFVATTTLYAAWRNINDLFMPMTNNLQTATQGYVNITLTAIIMVSAIIILFDSIRNWVGSNKKLQ